jgi:hypothetical protein
MHHLLSLCSEFVKLAIQLKERYRNNVKALSIGLKPTYMVRKSLRLSSKQKEKVRSVIIGVPRNEEEVKRIFFKIEEVLGFRLIQVSPSNQYPDAIYSFKDKEISVEFEYLSSHFKKQNHDERKCDLVICWEDDDNLLRTPTIELSNLVDNWKEKRQKAICDTCRYYYSLVFNAQSRKRASSMKLKLLALMKQFNFDTFDMLALQMGVSRSYATRYFSSLIKMIERMDVH